VGRGKAPAPVSSAEGQPTALQGKKTSDAARTGGVPSPRHRANRTGRQFFRGKVVLNPVDRLSLDDYRNLYFNEPLEP